MQEPPTLEQLQKMFPDYPCGREKCKYQGNRLYKAKQCANMDCAEFRAWFSKAWATIRKNVTK